MQVILKILKSKYFSWVLIAAVLAAVLKIGSCKLGEANERLETYKRQVQGQLSEKEKALQEANHKIGKLESELLSEKDLSKHWKNKKEERDEAFDELIKKHKLKIKSMDRTIASLRQKIKGGKTDVIIGDSCKNLDDCVIAYSWEDLDRRFKLKDPNIFQEGDEEFESRQLFKVYGEVYQQKNGSLLTKRLVLREVILDKDGKYVAIPGGKAEIVESEFKYSNPPELKLDWTWKDMFKMRAIAVASVTGIGNPGATKLGLGLEFMNYKGFGINTHAAFDFHDIKGWEHRLGVAYSPKKLNLGFGLSAGTPYANLFNDYSINLDLIFYLTN